ncbi:MAG: TonB family protein, partial [Treponema sp.]|nr:TonB family protein [Treponema sp.]
VQVRFYIDKDGNVTDAQVTKSVHPLLDDEAVKVVMASPKWKAGKVKGVKVRSYMTVPIDFKLEKKSKRSFGLKK